MRRKGILLTLTVLLAGILLSGLAEETLPPNMRVVNCKTDVSLREKPSTSARRLARVPLGAEVLAWTDGGDEGEAEDFLPCEYQGRQGYILREYLEPIAQEYDTGLGFSFRYNPYRMEPEPSMSESGNSLLIEWIGSEEGPAYLEILLPQVFQEDPQEYLAANTDYTETFAADSGAVVTGGCKTSEDFTLSDGFYIVTQEDRMLLVLTVCSTEIEEIVESEFQNILKTLSFGE